MSDDTGILDIRRFTTIEEIKDLPCFVENNPITTDTYLSLLGDYDFPEKIARCCRLKDSGKLCNEEHKYGFVATLTNGSCTIIGNCCAKDKFGADSKIRADRARVVNEQKRRQDLEQLRSLLAGKDDLLARLVRVVDRVKALQNTVSSFSANIGQPTARRLRDIARTGRATVFIEAITHREYIDEDGQKRRERSAAPAAIGVLNGLSIFKDYTYQSIQSGIRDARNAIKKAEGIVDNIKNSDLAALTSTISTIANIEAEMDAADKDKDAFFAGDLWLLCFILDDRAERYKVAKVVLELSGESAGKDKAKNWLSETEQRVRERLNADKIEIR